MVPAATYMIYSVRRISHLLKAHLILRTPSLTIDEPTKKDAEKNYHQDATLTARLKKLDKYSSVRLQRWFEHGSRGGEETRILFSEYFSDGQDGNKDVEVKRTTMVYHYQRMQRHPRGIENFSQKYVSFSNYCERSRSRWKEREE